MTVERMSYESSCECCEQYTEVYEIYITPDYPVARLCRKCLMELIKAIIERN